MAFNMLTQEECAEVAKPEWWNDDGLKGLSAKVVRAMPNHRATNRLRAEVLSGASDSWEAGPRSAAEFQMAAVHFDRAAALCIAPLQRAKRVSDADWCRSLAATML